MNISSSSIESVFLFLLLSTTTFQSDGFSYKNLVQTQDVSQATTKSISSSLSSQSSPLIKFPGGGIYFYWEIGAASYLRDYYDLNFSSKNDNNRRFVQFSGASAGALAATLTATDVDFEKTIKLALDLADQANVWERPLGLQGVWGSIIYEWLDELIPKNEDANDGLMKYLQNDRLTLLVTPVPAVPDLFSTPAPDLFSKTKVSSFQDRKELIDCNMASVHIVSSYSFTYFFSFSDMLIDGLTKYISLLLIPSFTAMVLRWKTDI